MFRNKIEAHVCRKPNNEDMKTSYITIIDPRNLPNEEKKTVITSENRR